MAFEYKTERGFMWPASDVRGADFIFGALPDLEVAYRHCRAFDVAVQAGGNCGLWPKDMAGKFRLVYTFEPDPMNFRCLAANVPEENVFKFNAALGNKRGTVGLYRYEANVGAHYVNEAGDIPVLCIDDLGLRACDLIYLDIEGCELQALYGAQHTIQRHRPTIVIEEKPGQPDRYGSAIGDAERFICQFGYKVVERLHRDVVMVPC